MDAKVARIVGVLDDEAEARGRHLGFGDQVIAATALGYGMTVITTNLNIFSRLEWLVRARRFFRTLDPSGSLLKNMLMYTLPFRRAPP
ncbi:hypothetical protein SAMN04487976_11084 [Xaviernesmea oryzae]|nr:hypothetical protein SAMN04487976_11084 [Xaviernesmea oryzae]